MADTGDCHQIPLALRPISASSSKLGTLGPRSHSAHNSGNCRFAANSVEDKRSFYGRSFGARSTTRAGGRKIPLRAGRSYSLCIFGGLYHSAEVEPRLGKGKRP